MIKGLMLLIITALLAFAPNTVLAGEEWQTRQIPLDVESGVVCVLDNCMMNLAACETPAAQTLRTVIREKMYKEGLNKEQTYAYIAQVYGEKALTSPPKKGFNWVAWLMPFIVAGGGVAIVYIGLERWVYHKNYEDDDEELEEREASQIDPEYEEKLKIELRRYLK